jgi:hypothetical protein
MVSQLMGDIQLRNRELVAFAGLYEQKPATPLTCLTGNRVIEVAVSETLNYESFN